MTLMVSQWWIKTLRCSNSDTHSDTQTYFSVKKKIMMTSDNSDFRNNKGMLIQEKIKFTY